MLLSAPAHSLGGWPALRARGLIATAVPAWTVAGSYLLFGAAALVVSGFDPFFFVFLVPGALVLVGALM